MSESKEVILEAKHVTRRFRTTDGRTLLANNDVNLKFYKGETLGLVGESEILKKVANVCPNSMKISLGV